MYAGKVKWFNNTKGFGFVVSEELNEDVFVHYSYIQANGYKTLEGGDPVKFELERKESGFHANPLYLDKSPTYDLSEIQMLKSRIEELEELVGN